MLKEITMKTIGLTNDGVCANIGAYTIIKLSAQ